MSKSIHVRSALIGGLVAGLVMTALPAVAAQIGSPMGLGVTNTVARKTKLVRTRAGTAMQVIARGGGTPLKLVSTDGSPPLLVTSATKVTRFNADTVDGQHGPFLGAAAKAADADKVDGRHANGLQRIAFAASDDLPDGSSGIFNFFSGEPLSVTITAPTAGWLIITGTVEAQNLIVNTVYRCRLRVDGSDVTGTSMISNIHDPSSQSEDCTSHGVQQVTAGTHTVTFLLSQVVTTTDLNAGSLSALFVPFDGTGAPSGL